MTEELRQENEVLRNQVLELSAQVEKMREVLEQSQSGLLWFMDNHPESVSEVDHEHQGNIDEALLIQPFAALQSYVNEEVAKMQEEAAIIFEEANLPVSAQVVEVLRNVAAERRNRK